MKKTRKILLIVVGIFLLCGQHSFAQAASVNCGQWSTVPVTCLQSVVDSNGGSQPAVCTAQTTTCADGTVAYYCGPPTSSQLCQQFGQNPDGTGPGVNSATFTKLNQAIFGAAGPDVQLTTPRGIISKLLPYLFSFGGLILFIMLIWGGFEMLTGAADPKSQQAGKERITAALVGFLLLFASFWLAQIVQRIFGISIL
ncbi:MAG: pilin [Candidatus Woesebacteria bacterium]